MAKIKQVTVNGTNYDIDATYFNGHDAKYWEDLIDAHMTIKGPYFGDSNPISEVIGTTYDRLYDGSTTVYPSESTEGSIYLFNRTGVTSKYWEYITTRTENVGEYVWTFIGTSQTDMGDYVRKGTYTTSTPSTNTTGTPSTNNSSTPIYDGEYTDIIDATLPVLATQGINSVTTFNLSPTVTSQGNHYHTIQTTGKPVVNTTPSWSASVNNEVLSFTFTSGSTTTIEEVSELMPDTGYVTGEAGLHYHSLQANYGTIVTSNTVVTAIDRSTIYYVGVAPTNTLIIPSYANVLLTIPTHYHEMGNHTHAMGNHTHSVNLGTPSV